MKIVFDVLSVLAFFAITGMVAFVLTDSRDNKACAKEFIDAEFKPLDEPTPQPDGGSWYWRQDSPLQKIASQTFMEELPPEVKRALRRNAEELEKVQKWCRYAAHAKKGRTRKKYRNKLREYYRSRPVPWWWLPSSMELTSGRGLDSGSPDVIWWYRRPGPIYPVGEGGRIADWGPRPL